MPHDTNAPSDDRGATPASYGHEAVRAGEAGIVPGALVRDRQDSEGSRAVVLDVFQNTADAVYCEIETPDGTDLKTVAELNPEAPRDDQVVKIAFVSELDGAIPEWPSIDRALLLNHVHEKPIRTYDYPKSRLHLEKL